MAGPFLRTLSLVVNGLQTLSSTLDCLLCIRDTLGLSHQKLIKQTNTFMVEYNHPMLPLENQSAFRRALNLLISFF